MSVSTQKVQEWLDAYEDDDDAVSKYADNVIVVSSSNSSSSGNNDDMQATVNNIDRIWNGMEAMLNQQTFVSALDAA